MNTEIKVLTDEWIEREARKRKQIPIAVFTIVAVHVALFLGLLGSAGCKKQAEAGSGSAAEEMRDREFRAAAAGLSGAGLLLGETAGQAVEEPVMAEPVVEEPQLSTLEGIDRKPVTTARVSSETGTKIYVVKPGDNLGKIARANGTTPQALKKANGLKSDVIRVGQKLRVS